MSGRTLAILMWKHLRVRMRRFIHTPVEFLSPIVFLLILFFLKDKINPPQGPDKFSNQIRNTDETPFERLSVPTHVYYTPDTNFTNDLMREAGQLLGLKPLSPAKFGKTKSPYYYPFSNWSELSEVLDKINNDDAFIEIHDQSADQNKLSYTIRMASMYSSNTFRSEGNTNTETHTNYGSDFNKFISLQWALDTSFIKLRSGQDVIQKLSVQEFPSVLREGGKQVKIICMLLQFLCWISLLLVFVFLMARLIEERSTGIQELVKMNGVSSNMFGISHFLNVLPGGVVFAVIGATLLTVSSNPVLPDVSWLVVATILFLYFVSVVAIAFSCSYITHSTQYTVSLSVFVYILLWLPAGHTKELTGSVATRALGMLPHMPMIWLWEEIAATAVYGQGFSFSDVWVSHLDQSGPVALAALYLIIQSLIFFALAWYLAKVRPGQYGQALPWNFLFQKQYWTKNEIKPESESDEEVPISRQAKYFEDTPKNADVGIKIENVTKMFPKHRALSNVTFDVLKGEITVLLGHNGAGKTTLMSIITGMMSATEGRVLVNGVDAAADARAGAAVRQQLGLCPQHNLFFADLTVVEHAMFFTLLKGGTYKEARARSLELLKSLGLQGKANVHSRALSGGMKRRLQLACALAGGANVLVLDEPTSGLDVETRRELWDLLLSLRGDRTVLLTTHFMEEADALGDRVAAVHQGHLRCHATPMYLKRAIGTGYRLTFTTNGTPRVAQITSAVTHHVPDASLKEQTINSLSYNLPAASSARFPELFSALEANKSSLQVETIGVGLTTLEEVFLKLCSDTDTTFHDDEIDGQNTTHPGSTFIKQTGVPLYIRQFCVLMKRQYKYIWHKKLSFLYMQLLLPVLILFAITYLSNDYEETVKITDTKLNFDLDLYDPLPTRRVYTDATKVDMRALTDSWPKVDFVTTNNISDAVLRVSQDEPTEYHKYIAGIEVDDTHAKALYTTTVKFAAPVAVNLVTNALATQYMGGVTGNTIETYFYPIKSHLPIPLQENTKIVEPKTLPNVIFYGVVVVFVVLATNINNVALPCAERASGARHIHLMSGCPALVHWLATLCFHMLLCALVLVLAVAVSAALLEREHTINSADVILTMMLVLVVGSLAFFALTYLVSCCFEERGASIMLIAILIIFGLVTATIKSGKDIMSEVGKGVSFSDVLLSICSYVAPPHAMMIAFMKTLYSARLNAYCDLNADKCPGLSIPEQGFDDEKCCSGEKVVSYMSLADLAPGKELITLAVHFLVYMTLVLLTQYGIFNQLCDRIMNTRYRNQARKKDEVDEIVRAEEVFVEKQIALPKKQIMQSEHALLAHDLHKNYICFGKNVNAVKGTSLSVKKGECFGLLGVNGAGKSTTFKMLTAEEYPTKGSIYANGHFRDERAPYLQSLGYCPQFFGLDDFLTGNENLNLVMTLRGLHAGDVKRETKSWIDCVGLEKYSKTKVCEYSGGCKRRIAAAAALCSGAPLTLLDEPTAGVDVSARRRVWAALCRGLRQGRAVVITSHSMDEMEALCNRIAIMSLGVVRALGTPAELRAQHAAGHAVLIKVTAQHAAHADQVDSVRSERDRLKASFQQKFNCTLKDEHKTMLHYHINESMRYSDLFSVMEELKQQHPALVEDYSVTESTLEEVFLSIAKEQHEIEEREREGRRNHVV